MDKDEDKDLLQVRFQELLSELDNKERCGYLKIREAFLEGMFFMFTHEKVAEEYSLSEIKEMLDL